MKLFLIGPLAVEVLSFKDFFFFFSIFSSDGHPDQRSGTIRIISVKGLE